MSKVSDNKVSKQARILEAAYKLFCDKTVNSTAIDDVVRYAGVAKGTFYLYFKDKYDLLDQIIIRKTSNVVVEAYKELIRARSVREMTAIEQLLFFTDYMIDFMKSNRKLTALIDKNMAACFRAVSEIDNRDFIDAINEFVEMFSNKGFTRDEAIRTLYIVTDMIGSACCDAVLYESPCSVDELRPTIHRLIEKMLA